MISQAVCPVSFLANLCCLPVVVRDKTELYLGRFTGNGGDEHYQHVWKCQVQEEKKTEMAQFSFSFNRIVSAL